MKSMSQKDVKFLVLKNPEIKWGCNKFVNFELKHFISRKLVNYNILFSIQMSDLLAIQRNSRMYSFIISAYLTSKSKKRFLPINWAFIELIKV